MSCCARGHNLQPGPCAEYRTGPPGCHGEQGRTRAAATLRTGPRWPPRAPSYMHISITHTLSKSYDNLQLPLCRLFLMQRALRMHVPLRTYAVGK